MRERGRERERERERERGGGEEKDRLRERETDRQRQRRRAIKWKQRHGSKVSKKSEKKIDLIVVKQTVKSIRLSLFY